MIADTNFVLDCLVPDRRHADPARAIVAELRQTGVSAILTVSTIHEVVYVLGAPVKRNGYGCSRTSIRRYLEYVLHEPGFAIEEPDLIEEALRTFSGRAGLSFHDCYLAARARASRVKLITFDERLKRVTGN